MVPVLKHDVFFRQYPVFTGDELAVHLAHIGSNGVRTPERVAERHSEPPFSAGQAGPQGRNHAEPVRFSTCPGCPWTST